MVGCFRFFNNQSILEHCNCMILETSFKSIAFLVLIASLMIAEVHLLWALLEVVYFHSSRAGGIHLRYVKQTLS